MTEIANSKQMQPKIGEGIYLSYDVAQILKLVKRTLLRKMPF